MTRQRLVRLRLVATAVLAAAGLLLGGCTVTAARHADGSAAAPVTAGPAGRWVGGAGPGGGGAGAPVDDVAPAAPVFLAATLRGANTVLVPGAPAVGDEDGRARIVVRIQGDQACFTVRYSGIEAPASAHIHAAAAGKDGPVAVGLFGTTLPRGLSVVTGCVTQDIPTLRAIIAVPELHHVDVHTAEFPGGAVRGQLRTMEHAVDLLASLGGPMVAMLDGSQAVPLPGDRGGLATGFVRPHDDTIDFAFTFTGIAPPTAGRLGPGAAGQAGGTEVDLFRRAGGLPPSVLGVAGTVRADRATVAAVAARPQDFHLDLDNADHPGGALRGQLAGR